MRARRAPSTLPASSHLITVALYKRDYYHPFTDKRRASREWMKCSWSCCIDSIPPNCPPCPDSSALHHVAKLGRPWTPNKLPLCSSRCLWVCCQLCLLCFLELQIPASMFICAPCSVYISTHIRAACVLMCVCVCVQPPLYCKPLMGKFCVSFISASLTHSA